jgi:large subunit ribosomal protein L10
MLKSQKITFVDNLTRDLKAAESLVLVNYTGLDVKGQQELKKRLETVDSYMVVVKNTLLKRAAVEAKLDKDMLTDEVLSGQTALIVANGDSVAPIQILGKFTKEFEKPKFKVGIVDGMFQDTANLTKLSTLPGRDALLSQLLGTLMSPMHGLVGTLQGPMSKLVYMLDQKSKS